MSGVNPHESLRAAVPAGPGPLQVTRLSCQALADAQPQALGLTYWFEAATDGEPYPVTVGFVGRRVGVEGEPGPSDTFSVLETIEGVLPGSGRIAVTKRVVGLSPGEWQVSATAAGAPARAGAGGAPTAALTRLPVGSASGPTGFAPVIRARAPGATPGAWPALVSLGALVALAVQGLVGAHLGLDGGSILATSLVAILVGVIGAKAYYLAQHRGEPAVQPWSVGMCIQGFVLGAIGTLALGALLAGIPVGRLLDATAPGLLFGMAIGRVGCFYGGCCAGRPSASRWALWSSDQSLGTRRVPTQLMESALAGALGAAALAAVWATPPEPTGVVFVGAIAAYTLGRQLLFPLRDLPRKTVRGRHLAMLAAALILAIDLAVAVLA